MFQRLDHDSDGDPLEGAFVEFELGYSSQLTPINANFFNDWNNAYELFSDTFDNIFSGLDNESADHAARNYFGLSSRTGLHVPSEPEKNPPAERPTRLSIYRHTLNSFELNSTVDTSDQSSSSQSSQTLPHGSSSPTSDALRYVFPDQITQYLVRDGKVNIPKAHPRSRTPAPRYLCDVLYCRGSFSRQSALQRHQDSEHGRGSQVYRCNYPDCHYAKLARGDKVREHCNIQRHGNPSNLDADSDEAQMALEASRWRRRSNRSRNNRRSR